VYKLLKMIADQSGLFIGHNINKHRKHALWGSRCVGTARALLVKRAIHATTEEARLNSVREFFFDGHGCRRIPHTAISSSTMLELELLAG